MQLGMLDVEVKQFYKFVHLLLFKTSIF